MKLLVTIILVFATVFYVGAQKPHYSAHNYVGLLEGEAGSALNVQTINGIKYKSWFTGIGAGLDYYRFRSIPLFLSLNKDIKLKEGALYLSSDAGVNIPWVKEVDNGWNNADFKRGNYAAVGIGYKFSINNQKQAFLVNAGYSFKSMFAETEMVFPCINPPCDADMEKTTYRLNRVLLRAGLEF
jgi:hypothetical protein